MTNVLRPLNTLQSERDRQNARRRARNTNSTVLCCWNLSRIRTICYGPVSYRRKFTTREKISANLPQQSYATEWHFFTAWRHASAVYAVACVRPSVRLSQVGVLSKSLNTPSRKQRHTITQGLQMSKTRTKFQCGLSYCWHQIQVS